MLSRRLFLFGASAVLAIAQPKVAPILVDRKGVAIEGFDPVAYFVDATPVKGDARFSFTADGATWWFATQAHRDAFAQAPQKYAPQFGGYCAYAVSEGYTAKIDPQAWKIVGGKLYLNYSKSVRATWEKDQDRRIATAEKNWPTLHR